MMRTYKVYGRNKNYIEGSITAQYEVDEGARHWMEFIPESKQKSYKCHGKVALHGEVYEGPEPPNSQGKPYQLTFLQHQQVRLWVLRHSDENTEWEGNTRHTVILLTEDQGASVRITFPG
ncbi:hypothetical protein MKW98_014276, partial [Papaver atlanticum]